MFVEEFDKIVVKESGKFVEELEFCYLLVEVGVDYLVDLEVAEDDVKLFVCLQ